jgi:hypothetical protein
VALALILTLTAFIRFDIEGDLEGIYILRGIGGKLFEVRDDVFLGEYERVLWKFDFQPLLAGSFTPKENRQEAASFLKYKWHQGKGHGYIQSFLSGGRKLILCFGRFLDSENKAPNGLFVGGGLPYSKYEDSMVKMNETGMAYYDGRNWQHIWCNANEAIVSASSPTTMIYPSSWQFLGSKVLLASNSEIIIKSSHQTSIDGVPVRIDRFALMRAGDTYFLLIIKLTNIGDKPTGYYYVYGDEPWVGDYGSSAGNVGWTAERLYNYEATVDPLRNSFAGMYDLGNKVVPGERGKFSKTANFIEWIGMVRPALVYFSNKEGKISDESMKVPLYSRDNRVLFLQWGPRPLLPNQPETIIMAIGMAAHDQRTDFPRKPEVKINWDDLNYLLK